MLFVYLKGMNANFKKEVILSFTEKWIRNLNSFKILKVNNPRKIRNKTRHQNFKYLLLIFKKLYSSNILIKFCKRVIQSLYGAYYLIKGRGIQAKIDELKEKKMVSPGKS